MTGRSAEKVLADLFEAIGAANELVSRGRAAFDDDWMLRLASEAIIGRVGDCARKLVETYGTDLPAEIPWRDVVGHRILVDHAYHRIDYAVMWATLAVDVPALGAVMRRWVTARGIALDE